MQSEGRDDKMDESESHAWKAISDVDQFVYKDNADGRGQVEHNAHSHSEIAL